MINWRHNGSITDDFFKYCKIQHLESHNLFSSSTNSNFDHKCENIKLNLRWQINSLENLPRQKECQTIFHILRITTITFSFFHIFLNGYCSFVSLAHLISLFMKRKNFCFRDYSFHFLPFLCFFISVLF